MQLTTFTLGTLRTNCYLLTDEATGQALVFDPGYGPGPVIQALEGYALQAVVLTHGHWDHCHGAAALQAATGAPVWISEIERDWPVDPLLNRSALKPDLCPTRCTGPVPDRLLIHGDTFSFAGRTFRALHVPGHTPGSLCYCTDGLVISGDTLFRSTVGRTDLPGGSRAVLIDAIRMQLLTLPDETAVYPGHGAPTTIGRERTQNPHLLFSPSSGNKVRQ
jgi:glyoxylase-like metal-dependent hydrolase (beta-lactamase superfamily II)